MVVVLIPPAVEPGLPPINIRSTVSILELVVRPAVSIVLNPAVLAVTELNAEVRTASLADIPAIRPSFSNK